MKRVWSTEKSGDQTRFKFWMHFVSLLVAAAEGMVEADDSLDFFISVRNLCELCLEEVLLSCEYLKVVSETVFHQELCIPYSSLESNHLFAVDLESLTRSLPTHKSIVDFYTSVEDCLTELVFCGFLLCLCSFEASLVGTFREDRLNEGADHTCYYTTRIDDHGTVAICPSETAAEAEIRIEGSTG